MAEERTETSPTTLNWWPDLHVSSLSSWSSNIKTNTNTNNNPWQPPNPNSNSSGEDDVSISTSFTNVSNQSGISAESSYHIVESASANELIGETASDNQLWSHVLFVGSSAELNSTQGENSINMLSSKSLSSAGMMFDPACDYLKKMDSSWEFTNPPSVMNNFEKHVNGFNDSLIENERLTKLSSNLVTNWSIAPPDSEINHKFRNISLSSAIDRFSQSDLCHSKQTANNLASFGGSINRNNSGSFSYYGGHEMKVKDEHGEIGTPGGLFRQALNTNGIEYLYNSILGDNNKYYYGLPDVPCNGTRSFADVVSSNSFSSKPSSVGIHASKPVLRSLNLSDCKKQGIQASSHPTTISTSHTVTRSNGRGQGNTSEGKKKRSEENSETPIKKPKHESSSKMQVTKVKIGDKITALQQIVSPFGKTDTASVLGEAIGYIKFLQEQVQLLSNPYMKTNVNKVEPWGGLDRKDRGGDVKLDLKSRGLCLVPISCTPQIYRDNAGSDYWTPTYRGCLYR